MANVFSSESRKVLTTGILITGILVLTYIVSQWVYTTVDATEERRYTLAPATKELLQGLEDRVYIKVLLTGRFPAGFKRLQDATEEMLYRFAQTSGEIEYNFENPNEGSVEEVNERRAQLAQDGIIPTKLKISDAAGASSQYIYPFAIIHYGTRTIAVNLLQDDIPGADKEVILNNSISLLEYKLADGIQKIKRNIRQIVAFSTGHGELTPLQTASFEKDISNAYAVNRINLDSISRIPKDIRVLIIAKPTIPFSEVHLFMLDQYIMHGGHVMFLIDPLVVSLDSINQRRNYIPPPYDLGLDPLFFKLGARVNPNLVLDLQCTRIPMVVGMQGDKVQTELFPWYYHPLISSTADHPITKNLDRIQLEFPASIDTVQTATSIRKTILLQSSEYTRIQMTPVRLNFDILREQPDPKLFNKGPQALAVMLEGQFQSLYTNRLNNEQLAVVEKTGQPFKASGDSSKILIVTDGDIIKNLVNSSTGETAPLGYNKYENTSFTGNRDFLLNTIEYMLDESGVLEARSKDIKLRLLNAVRAQEEGLKWQLINILGPLAVILVLGLVFHFLRRRKFAA